MKREIIVVTAAYGRDRINAVGGQHALLPVIAAAGADGVEIRRELFSEEEHRDLSGLGAAIASARLTAFYSVPEALFTEKGLLNPQIERHVFEATQLNARLIKYSLGHYRRGFDCTLLREKLADQAIHLVVENDQTDCGTLAAMDAWFHDCGEAGISNGMTFDIGNWLWVGEDPVKAAERLNRFVRYIHVKAATPHPTGWRALALDDADNRWRETLSLLPPDVPRGIEFPLEGDDLIAVTRHYVDLLREE